MSLVVIIFIMDIACSACLESFTLDCDVSTTPCGHLFHTNCINKWIKNEKRDCPQCRQSCTLDQLMKIYFSGTNTNNGKGCLISEKYFLLLSGPILRKICQTRTLNFSTFC